MCGRWEGHKELRWEHLREKDHFEGLRSKGNILLKWNFTELYGAVDWINLDYKRDMRQAIANEVTKLQVS